MQQAGRRAHGRASQAWSALPKAARTAWETWAQAQGGKEQTTFTGLYGKMLRLDPSAVAPASPPSVPFYGDAVTVTVSGSSSFHSGERKGLGDGERETVALSLHPPEEERKTTCDESSSCSSFRRTLPLSQAKEGEPAIVFVASGPNRAGVVTEPLVQPLLSAARRTYLDKYRGAAYVAFAAGHLSASLPVTARYVALAYRFVEIATERQTALVELGVVEVG